MLQKPDNIVNSTSHDDLFISTKTLSEQKVRLPKLSIQKFDGDIANWQNFYDIFKSVIDQNESISDIDKFSYLKFLLCDSALSVISSLSLISKNYKETLDLLKERYGNTQALITTQMKNFVQLPQVGHEPDAIGLRKYYDTLESSIRNLKSLDIEFESYGKLLVPLILPKLPHELSI